MWSAMAQNKRWSAQKTSAESQVPYCYPFCKHGRLFIMRRSEEWQLQYISTPCPYPPHPVMHQSNIQSKHRIYFSKSYLDYANTLPQTRLWTPSRTHRLPDGGLDQVVVRAEHDVGVLLEVPAGVVGTGADAAPQADQLLQGPGLGQPLSRQLLLEAQPLAGPREVAA